MRRPRVAAVSLVGGACFDVLENLLSFAVLARHDRVPQWLAVLCSSAATAKFALLGLGMAASIAALALLLAHRLVRRSR